MRFNDAWDKALEDCKKAFQEDLQEYMEKNDKDCVVITGWTPYFNDGDTCTYGIHGSAAVKFTNETDDEKWDIIHDLRYEYDLYFVKPSFFGIVYEEGQHVFWRDGRHTYHEIDHD